MIIIIALHALASLVAVFIAVLVVFSIIASLFSPWHGLDPWYMQMYIFWRLVWIVVAVALAAYGWSPIT